MTVFRKAFTPRFVAATVLTLVFTLLGPIASAQGIYPSPEAAPALSLRVTGTVEVVVPFSGGYAIGGNFDRINGADRRNVALVDVDGALLPWTADTDATVRALAVSGDDLYVGGDFSSIGGQSRAFAAKLSLLDGSVDAGFQPAPNAAVRALALDAANGQVFLGGVFTSVGGTSRDRTAKVDGSDGSLVTTWSPGYAGADQINALVYDAANGHLYVGGTVKMTLGGGGHNRAIGRLSGSTGARDTGWSVQMHPKGGAQVWSIALDSANDRVYFGGQFRRIQNQNGLDNVARVARTNAALDAGWNPGTDGPVRVVALDGSDVLIGGDFSQVGGLSRQRLARVDAAGSAVVGFAANADRPVRTIALGGAQAIVGGAFRFLGGDTEEGLARIATATGARDGSFAGAVGGPGRINDFVFDAAGGVIAGGEFDFVEHPGDPTIYTRQNMLRLAPDFSLDTGWAANVSGDVQAIAIDGNDLYIGGSFIEVTDPVVGTPVARGRLARYLISGVTPVLAAWTPVADGDVVELVADADGIYAGGLFLTLAGSAHTFAGRLDATTGAAHAWDPGVDGPVYAFAPNGSDVAVGGDFSVAGGQTRANFAIVDDAVGIDTGAVIADADNAVRALALDGGLLYVGGSFSMLQGAARSGAARIDLGTSLVDDWNPSIGGTVRALAFDDPNGWVYFGGSFGTAAGWPHPNLARASTADMNGGVDNAWRPGTNGPVLTIAGLATSDVLVGGDFAFVTNEARGGIARLGPDGSDLTAVTIDSIAPEPSVAGDAWTTSFTVSNTSGGGIPTGSVMVTTDAGESCGPIVLDGAGQGSCDITSTLAGTRVVTVHFTADSPELMDSTGTDSHEVVPAAVDPVEVQTLIEATDDAATADGVDTGAVRVTLSDEFGNPVPGVAVSIATTGSAVLASAAGSTDSAGQFATTLTSTVAEAVDVTAMFDSTGDSTPDAAVTNGSPAVVTFSAGPVDPDPEGATVLEIIDGSAVANGSDTAEVRVTLTDGFGNPVAGIAVGFTATGSAVLATAAGTTDANGQLATTLTSTTIESVDVSAMFDSDDDSTPDTAVNGSPVTVGFVAETIPTTTTITGDTPDPSVVGQGYTVSFQVDASAAATGSVQVSDGDGGTCNDTLEAGDNGAGSCVLTSTSAGARTLVASFTGSGSFENSVSAGVAHAVNQAATSLSLFASSSIVTEGDSVTFSWTLDVVSPGGGTPTGMVTVTDGGSQSCAASVAAGSCQITLSTAGNFDFNGSYAGDADFLGDSDGPVGVDVQSGGVSIADIVVRHEIVGSGILSDGSGDLVDYELDVSNAGAADVTNVDVDMLMPPEFTDIAWTCTASGGANCGIAAGTGDIDMTSGIPAGGSILIELSVRIVDPDDNGVATAAFAATTDAETSLDNNAGTTFYRTCSASELLVVGEFTSLPAHVCGFRDGFEERTTD